MDMTDLWDNCLNEKSCYVMKHISSLEREKDKQTDRDKKVKSKNKTKSKKCKKWVKTL